MTKAEKNKAREFIRRSELMARVNTITDLLRQIGEIVDPIEDASFIHQMGKVVKILNSSEAITDVWIDEYQKAFVEPKKSKKAGGVH